MKMRREGYGQICLRETNLLQSVLEGKILNVKSITSVDGRGSGRFHHYAKF